MTRHEQVDQFVEFVTQSAAAMVHRANVLIDGITYVDGRLAPEVKEWTDEICTLMLAMSRKMQSIADKAKPYTQARDDDQYGSILKTTVEKTNAIRIY